MQVIVKPILSEKMTALTDKQNRVAFVVSKAANKLEIKRAVEAMYSVTVKPDEPMLNISTINYTFTLLFHYINKQFKSQ